MDSVERRVPVRDVTLEAPQLINISSFIRNLVYRRSWLIAFIVLDILIANAIVTVPEINDAWVFITPGIQVTIQITIIAFIGALILGLITALGRISRNPIIYNISTFYVEIFRGLPLLVIIMIFAFVIAPELVNLISGGPLDDFVQQFFGIDAEKAATTILRSRDVDLIWRIMLAFAMTYGAFMSEVFRAGIESIGRGQMEAARSLGMTYFQAMRHIILPQAIRTVLPALANNFVLLLKDTSLATVVAVPEISHLTKQYYSSRFRYAEGLLVLSFLYANLTVILSMGVYYMEARLHGEKRES